MYSIYILVDEANVIQYLPTSETPKQGHDPHSRKIGHNYCNSYDIISSLICIINDYMYVQINSCINKLCHRL